jgi:hypothetical protein
MPRIEILHGRDPDSSCELTVFIDGVPTNDWSEIDVDPGAGHDRESWQERIDDTRADEHLTPGFREAAARELEGALDSPYIV